MTEWAACISQAPSPEPSPTLCHSLKRTSVNYYFLLLYLLLTSPMNRNLNTISRSKMAFARWARVAPAGLSLHYVEWDRNRVLFLPKSLQLCLCFQAAKRKYHEKIDSQINGSIKATITTLERTTGAARCWEEARTALRRTAPSTDTCSSSGSLLCRWILSLLLILADRKSQDFRGRLLLSSAYVCPQHPLLSHQTESGTVSNRLQARHTPFLPSSSPPAQSLHLSPHSLLLLV